MAGLIPESYVLPILLVGLLIVLAVAGILLLWHRRTTAPTTLPAPQAPEPGTPLLAAPVEGMYVTTTRAGDPLDRVAVHGLGVRTTAWLSVAETGVVLDPAGRSDFLIPRADLRAVGTTSGMIGKFVEADGLLAITWCLGDELLTTGFRTRYAADRGPLLEHISQLIPEAP